MDNVTMTPEQFDENMRKLLAHYDAEEAHREADNLMCELLRSLGYGEGVQAFLESTRWYA